MTELTSYFGLETCVSRSGTGMAALPFRSHFRYAAPVTTSLTNLQDGADPAIDNCGCYQAVGSEYDLCLDEFCVKPPPCEYTSYDRAPRNLLQPSEKSLKNDVCTYSLIHIDSNTSACIDEYRCNWNPSLSGSSSHPIECVPDGVSVTFCGAHFTADDELFYEIVNTSEVECGFNDGRVCVTPSGSILLGELSNETCLNVGHCTAECPSTDNAWVCLPLDRSEPSICYSDRDTMDQSWCEQLTGEWRDNQVCVLPLQNNRDECARNGNVFIECQSLPIDECDTSPYLMCYASNTSTVCKTKDECEGSGFGQCSDIDYFVNYVTSPPSSGACVLPFQIDTSDSAFRQFCFENTIPLSIGCA
jgi:hypothetical protein